MDGPQDQQTNQSSSPASRMRFLGSARRHLTTCAKTLCISLRTKHQASSLARSTQPLRLQESLRTYLSYRDNGASPLEASTSTSTSRSSSGSEDSTLAEMRSWSIRLESAEYRQCWGCAGCGLSGSHREQPSPRARHRCNSQLTLSFQVLVGWLGLPFQRQKKRKLRAFILAPVVWLPMHRHAEGFAVQLSEAGFGWLNLVGVLTRRANVMVQSEAPEARPWSTITSKDDRAQARTSCRRNPAFHFRRTNNPDCHLRSRGQSATASEPDSTRWCAFTREGSGAAAGSEQKCQDNGSSANENTTRALERTEVATLLLKHLITGLPPSRPITEAINQ